jgi:hypothetical protein
MDRREGARDLSASRRQHPITTSASVRPRTGQRFFVEGRATVAKIVEIRNALAGRDRGGVP